MIDQPSQPKLWASLVGHTAAMVLPPPASSNVQAERERQAEIERELQLARDIQQGLLLEAVPRLPGWEISAVSLPARDLGGDLYDFLALGGCRHGIMIGDVSGKGLPAALRMAVARTVFRHAARRGQLPASTLAAVNQGVLLEIPHGMVTMLYATLDTQRGELRLANAGHNYPLLVKQQVGEIELTGMPLGVDSESEYHELAVTLEYGDSVLLYTDGVVEAVDDQGAMFGDERLVALVQANTNQKPRALVALILAELRAWSGVVQADDITMVVVRRRLAWVGAELRAAAADVLGAERAALLWQSQPLPGTDAPVGAWAEALPALVQAAQTSYGRGLSRELQGQLRPVVEEYRSGEGRSVR